jgi:hypothetical protein
LLGSDISQPALRWAKIAESLNFLFTCALACSWVAMRRRLQRRDFPGFVAELEKTRNLDFAPVTTLAHRLLRQHAQ